MFNRLYKKILEAEELEEDKIHYSCIPLELEYIEHLRKEPSISISKMNDFCENLVNITRISLNAIDIAEAIDDEDYEINYFSSRINPYHLAARTAIIYKKDKWWSEALYNQYRENYDEI